MTRSSCPTASQLEMLVACCQDYPGGTRVRVISGRYAGRTGTVDANVFHRTADYPEEFATGFHLVLDHGTWVTVRRD